MRGPEFPEDPERKMDEDIDDMQSSVLAELIEAGRAEQPEGTLAERIRRSLAYRKSLVQPPRKARRRVSVLTTAGVALAAAFGLIILRRVDTHSKVKISPESTLAAGSASNQAAAKVSAPAPDPCTARNSALGKQPLIDNFEDGDDEVSLFEGRAGLWRWVRDTDAAGTAPALLPIPRSIAKPGNRLAIHVKGGRLLDWGAVVEFNFVPACYDASVYRGLSFQAKGPGRLFVGPREVGVIPVANGGTCVEDCHNGHAKKVDLDAQWRTYEVLWSEVAQRGYNKPQLDPKRLNSLAFLVHPEDTPYDLWIDEVKFLVR